MNKHFSPKLFFSLIPTLTLISFAAFISAPKANLAEVSAAPSGYQGTALPTTIYLNDCAEPEVRAYYSSLNNKNYSGEDLLKALKPILSDEQQYHSYDANNGKAIWQMYEITDRDWTLSPASAITQGHYDAESNTITNYKYGQSVSNPGADNPYVHLLYRNRGDETGNHRAWDTHGISSGINGFDREHIWPKSRGFDDDETGLYGARGDIHHLWAGDHYVNSSLHNNDAYGFVDVSDEKTVHGASKYDYLKGNYRGVSKTLGSGIVFEPQDCDKGDIARACFYMVARYNNLAQNDETIDAGNPNLFLDDTISTETVTSTATNPVSIGVLRDLLAWHHLDPVDDYEIHRNNLIFNNFTKNRNPFIDFPNWVDAIWGTVTFDENARKVTEYNKAPVGTANPASDALYQEGEQPTLAKLEFGGEPTKKEYTEGEAFDPTGIKVTATYSDDSTKDVTSAVKWDSLKVGDTSVKGTYTSNGVTLTINISGLTVKEQAKINIFQPPYIYFIIAAAVVVIILIIVFIVVAKKSGTKKAVKTVKKIYKTASGSSSKSTSKKKSSKKK